MGLGDQAPRTGVRCCLGVTQGRTEKWTRDLRTEAPLVLALVWKFLKARLGFEKGRRVGRGAAGAASDEDSCCQGDAPAVTSLLVACSLAQAWGGGGTPASGSFSRRPAPQNKD